MRDGISRGQREGIRESFTKATFQAGRNVRRPLVSLDLGVLGATGKAELMGQPKRSGSHRLACPFVLLLEPEQDRRGLAVAPAAQQPSGPGKRATLTPP
jgi:hypothetical protein